VILFVDSFLASFDIRKIVSAGLRRDANLQQRFERDLHACIESDEGLAYALGHLNGVNSTTTTPIGTGGELQSTTINSNGRSQLASGGVGLGSNGSYHQSSLVKILLGALNTD
jgi:hypothetical protein